MNWADLGRSLAGIGLPALGGALLGPAGAIAGADIARRIGAAEATPEVISQAIEADPAALVELRRLEVEMAKVDASREARSAESAEKMLATATADVQNARATGKDDTVRRWLAAPTVLAPVAFAFWLLSAQPADPSSIGMFVLGFLTNQAGQVFNFFFGTSIGSAKKQIEINSMKDKN